ncbi:Kar1p Ecym_6431 [Eremothecium cymbalariae DBVPG|uniref:Uncharacterized protein n=1 Tax=Eremothecium cymbalariae (strain CBS 270.75 / DBVPG 7215 / KCTC 17166 / NRRL Y-17582) TaxID=931890 RepID=G8JUM2_ERECY|nr:hypothetical protein Ecym_6431 [Eremothecium cymbalariae DBVPG\
MGSTYLPSRESRLMSESRVSKINKLYEDVQRRRHNQVTNHSHRDSVVSNNSTSVVTVDIPSPDDLTMSQEFINRDKSSGFSDITLKPHTLHAIRGVSPTRKYRNNLQSPINSDSEMMPEDDEAADLTPRLRSRRSIIRLSAESTPYRHSNQQTVYEMTQGTNSSANASRVGYRKYNTRTQLRSQLGQPVPLGYISTMSEQPVNDQQTSINENMDLESRLRKIMQKDKATFERRLQQIRQHYYQHPPSSVNEDMTHSIMQNSVTDRNFDTSRQEGSVYDNSESEKIKNELHKTVEKLEEVLSLLHPTPSNYHFEFVMWSGCIIILTICNVYVYYFL